MQSGLSPNEYKAEIQQIWWQTLAFLVRVAQFCVAVGVHYGVHHYILPMAIRPEWTGPNALFEVIFFVAFGLMYTQQIYDMVTIFVPWARQLRSAEEK